MQNYVTKGLSTADFILMRRNYKIMTHSEFMKQPNEGYPQEGSAQVP